MIQSAQGLQQAEGQLNQVAQTLATPQSDSVNLSAEAVALIQAKNNFEANLKTLEAGDELTKNLLATLSTHSS